MFDKVFRAGLSLGAVIAVICLAYYETKNAVQISPRAYAILAGVAFGASIDDITKIITIRKK